MSWLGRAMEVFDTLQRRPFRTALTAFSVAWGVFVLVVLLGVGEGLKNAMTWQFRDDASNSIWVYPGRTSVAHAGYGIDRRVELDLGDHQAVGEQIESVDHLTSRFYVRSDKGVSYKGETGPYDVRSVHPDHRFLERTIMQRGRFISDRDLEQRRKVAVVGEAAATELFEGVEPIGEWIDVAGVSFKVVGVFTDVGGPGEERNVYLPITTAQSLFGGTDDVDQILFTVGDAGVEEALAAEDEVRSLLAGRHHFAADDSSALRIRNVVERFSKVQSTFAMLDSFLWLAGVGTVLAGIVGVSNIMLVSVAERTSEIGLRKAIGAVPSDIVGGIVAEAVLLTSVAGYSGLVAGVGVVEAVRQFAPDNDYIRDPGVELHVVGAAVALLVVAGAVAGFVPAWQAARINPATALVRR